MTTINTNVKALFVRNALQANEASLTSAMQQLSTGKRINSAKDDAVGLAISTRMTQQIRALDQAVRNANDAISMVQTTEGATQEITTMLQRMRELAIQAMNDTNANDQRSYLDLEFQQLKQQIVQIANNTEWNGFPILNGTAGQQVGPVPVFKTVANGQLSTDLTYTAGGITTSNAGEIATGGTGTLAKSGSLAVTVAANGTAVNATLTMEDGNQVTLTGSFSGRVITFTNTALTDGAGTFTLTSGGSNAADWAAGDTVSFDITRSMPSVAAAGNGDLIINGTTVPVAVADGRSPSGNATASAIARVAAINSVAHSSEVYAVAGVTVMSGTAMKGAAVTSGVSTGTVTINGYTSPQITTVENNPQATREAVITAINRMAAQTGIMAFDGGDDSKGVRLEAADGRNIEIAFNTESKAADFAARTGLKQGVQTGSYALESKIDVPVVISSGHDITTTGLQAGSFAANRSVISSGARTVAAGASDVRVLGAGDLIINNVPVPAANADDDVVSNETAASSEKRASAIAIAAAINAVRDKTGVSATANSVSTEGDSTSTTVQGVQSLFINGRRVNVTLGSDAAVNRAEIVAKVAVAFGDGGVVATDNLTGIKLTSTDGRNLSVWYDSSVAGLSADNFGLNTDDVVGIANATTTSTGAKTLYAGVSLSSTVPDAPEPRTPVLAGSAPRNGLIHIATGKNGYGATSSFTALGFVEGTFGGKSSVEMSPPKVGRLTFQIGASAGQEVTIDLADYGSKGPITGGITGDVGEAVSTIQIATAEGANAVLKALDSAMDKVNADRAKMGAVMNRLQHVVENLSNVSTNSAASRSQIEDADYAKASSDLARAQIIQQAATAVLAQANTSQQTVLKLLQG
jgi:flagellin